MFLFEMVTVPFSQSHWKEMFIINNTCPYFQACRLYLLSSPQGLPFVQRKEITFNLLGGDQVTSHFEPTLFIVHS